MTPNLSLKDPAFVGAATIAEPCEDTNSEVSGGGGTGGWGVYGDADLGVGMSFDAGHYLVGKEICTVTFWLYNNGTCLGGNTYANLWTGSDRTSPRATSDAISMSSIGNGASNMSAQKYTFSSPATLIAGDYMTADIASCGVAVNWASDGSAYQTNTIAQEYRSTTGGWQAKTFGNRFMVECNC